MRASNVIFQGDNLNLMKELEGGKIDLIYIDPPFNTGTIRKSKAGVFDDKWEGGIASYTLWLENRLREMHRLLKPTGSLFVHLDWRMAHYVKIELDKIFSVKNPASKNTNFMNEIIWWYGGGGASKNNFAKKHDTILFYAKNYKKHKFYCDNVREPYKWTKGQKRADGSNRDYSKGKIPDDVFQINSIMPWSSEKVGYPTQKPMELLNKIIKSSTKEGDLVADFFCGCGTTISSAHGLERRWIGCDISSQAIKVIKKRMERDHNLKIQVIKYS